MRFDYGTQLSPSPIVLSVGTLIKPTLRDISDNTKGMSFDKFNYYEFLMKMTPESFYTKLKGDEGKTYWESLSEDEQDELSIYKVVVDDEQLSTAFTEMFNFFFLERVIFKEGYFVLLKENGNEDIMSEDDIRGVISEKIFSQVLDSIQQICCIADDDDEDEEPPKFKNKIAEKLYYKMKRAKKKEREMRKADINLTMPNIISAVSNKHPTVNPINVWDLTVFQLLDAFNRMQVNSMYDIDATRVSVWGDSNKNFKPELWYKNEYDKK